MDYIEQGRVNEVKNINFKIKNISNQYKAIKSTCRIECSGNVGSGFLIKLKKDNKPFYCLMTCEHVINKRMINSKETINVKYDCKIKNIDIKLDSRFIKCYKYLGIDATVIEILEKDGIKEEFFLLPNYDYKKGYEQFKYKSIVIIQYPGGNDLSESEGIITETNQYIHGFTHISSTESGSSGGLIVLSENSEVLGIHKQGNLEKNENYGNFIGPIIDSLINNYLYEEKLIGEKIIECETNLSNYKSFGRLKYKREYIYIGELKNYEMDGKGVKYIINNNIIIKEYEGDFVKGIYEGNGTFYIYDENGNLLNYYIGQMINDKVHGKGKLYKKNHDILYEGEFAFGKYEGFGRLNQDNNEHYEGYFNDGYLDGKGKYFKENKIIYEGDFKFDVFHGEGRLNYKDGTFYFGQFSNGVRHGNGILLDENKIIYEGEFKLDKYDGKGKYYEEDGSYYIGEFSKGKKNGNGIVYNKDKNIKYEGQLKDERANGKGFANLGDGLYYYGELKNGYLHGKGIIRDENNKIIYDGDFKSGKFDGEGTLYYTGGNHYIGEFRKGVRHGNGTLLDESNNKIYEGEFKFNEFEGKGKKYDSNEVLEYEGEFSSSLYQGFGKKYLIDGYYEGNFINGEYHGKGTLYYKDGKICYHGEFQNGKFNGEGTFYSKDGLKYIGIFNNDEINGKGKLINQENGKIIYEGDFKLGKMDGNGKFYFDNNYYYIGQFKDNKKEGDGTVYDEKGKIEYEGKFKNDQPQDSIILQKLFSIFKLK